MELEKAVELLQGATFGMEEAFWSDLGGDVTVEYTLEVVDSEILLKDIDIDLGEVNMDDLRDKVEDGLYSIMDGGSEGVARF